ncbi:MAG: CoA-binding protein [Candidatus Bathyarchaeia archaeon]|jgi:acetyltransferase
MQESSLTKELDCIFNPKSIAIIGASAESKKLGNRILSNLINRKFPGKLFPINPHIREIMSFRAYSRVAEVPDKIDLAVIVVPALAVLQAMKECVEKEIKGAVVITSGFAETGAKGRELQEKMAEIAEKGGLRFVGPNCEGIFNASANLDLTFAPKSPKKGGISFISQSGAIGANTMFRWGAERGVGFQVFCSSGNEADLGSTDYLEYVSLDKDTRVVMMYVEGVKKGKLFLEAARRTTMTKPIVLMKGGQTEAGSRAVSSHTGVLSGSNVIFDAVCKQTGIVKVEDVDELFDVSMTFETQPLPKGSNVGIVTGAGGGMGVVAVDACTKRELNVPIFSKDTIAQLKAILPPYAPVNNPVDLTPPFDPMRLVKCTEIVLRDKIIDSVISMGFGWRTDMVSVELAAVEEFIKLKEYGKPIVMVSVASKCEFEVLRKLEAEGVPVFLTPGKASRAIAALVEYQKYRSKQRVF